MKNTNKPADMESKSEWEKALRDRAEAFRVADDPRGKPVTYDRYFDSK